MSWNFIGPSSPPKARILVPASLRPSSSQSSLLIPGHPGVAEPSPGPTPGHNPTLDSTAPSVINMDLNDGILLQDAEVGTEPDAEDITAITLDSDRGKIDEASKKSLRDQLRRTLSKKLSGADLARSVSSLKGKEREFQNPPFEEALRYPPRQYFVLTDAGKPVFVRKVEQPEGEDSTNTTNTIGIMQALISVFIDDNDKLRCINAGHTRISFLIRSPLYYVCASSWGEPESVTRSHLEFLHLQILSIVTATQLRRIFERRTNFDLGRLLTGAEVFLNCLLDRLEFDLSMSTSSLQCLKLDSGLRRKLAEALLPTSKMKEILYILLVAQGKVVTLIRPRKHSIHPADIHIIMNTIHSPSVQNSPATSSWIPVCLPKFNPAGFIDAYVAFLEGSSNSFQGSDTNQDPTMVPNMHPSSEQITARDGTSKATLVCISSGGDFDMIRTWCESVTSRLHREGSLNALLEICASDQTEYTASSLGIPGLRHFVYKSRPHVQITSPVFEDPYDSPDDQRRLITLYQILHDAIHAKSGQEGTLKLQYIKTEKESVMGWITQPFELYITVSARMPKTAVIGAANAVARWVKKEEAKLFLRDAPVF